MTTFESTKHSASGWQRLLIGLRKFDEILNQDPTEQEMERLQAKVSRMEGKLRDLETGS